MSRVAASAPDALGKAGEKELIIRNCPGPLFKERLICFLLFVSDEQASISTSIA
jgi:hypothetical protein